MLFFVWISLKTNRQRDYNFNIEFVFNLNVKQNNKKIFNTIIKKYYNSKTGCKVAKSLKKS